MTRWIGMRDKRKRKRKRWRTVRDQVEERGKPHVSMRRRERGRGGDRASLHKINPHISPAFRGTTNQIRS